MTRFTDKDHNILEITMCVWKGDHYTPDFSADFFNTGSLPYDKEVDASVVDDLDRLIEQARDWENAEGDEYEKDTDTEDRVIVYDLIENTDAWFIFDRNGEMIDVAASDRDGVFREAKLYAEDYHDDVTVYHGNIPRFTVSWDDANGVEVEEIG